MIYYYFVNVYFLMSEPCKNFYCQFSSGGVTLSLVPGEHLSIKLSNVVVPIVPVLEKIFQRSCFDGGFFALRY